jgi:hypothetical protein
VPHVHLDREGDRDLRTIVVHRLPSKLGHPGHVDEQIVLSEPQRTAVATLALSEQVQGRTDAERGKDVSRNLQTELATDHPGLLVTRQIDLAAHNHRDKLVGRGKVLVIDAGCVLGVFICGRVVRSGTLEIAEGRAAPRIEQGLDGGVGVLGRVMDLRDVVNRRDAVVELAQASEQLVDIDVLRPVDGGEFQQNVLVISRSPGRRARAVVDQDPIG